MEHLTPAEAARVLHSQIGFAGYSLINSDTNGEDRLAHAIWCPTCGNQIGAVEVTFVPPPATPEPGSKMAILLDIAKAYAAIPEKYKKGTAPKKVVPISN